MKLLLIDDEAEVRQALREIISNSSVGIESICEADGVSTGLKAIQLEKPDIVLLDIGLQDGTGFDLLKQIPNPTFQLIFITAYQQFAIQAFKVSAIDYLLKPIDPFELQQTLYKAKENIANEVFRHQLQVLMQQLLPKQEADMQIVLKDIDRTYFVKLNEILFCEAEGSYTKFYLTNKETILVSRNLHTYEELLAPSGFIRTHHSCVVNPNKIKVFDRKTDNGSLILESGHVIPVSQRKREYIIHFLENRL
ncbi:MAG: LytTR family DNA-binding domain-containing protein [Spirosomataceae bacterium]